MDITKMRLEVCEKCKAEHIVEYVVRCFGVKPSTGELIEIPLPQEWTVTCGTCNTKLRNRGE